MFSKVQPKKFLPLLIFDSQDLKLPKKKVLPFRVFMHQVNFFEHNGEEYYQEFFDI